MLAASRATGFIAQGIVSAWLAIAIAFGWMQHAAAAEPVRHYDIRESSLSAALIQFSRQSNTPIVFSDRLTGHLSAPTLVGELTRDDALDRLLAESELNWELIDERIVAIYSSDCPQERC